MALETLIDDEPNWADWHKNEDWVGSSPKRKHSCTIATKDNVCQGGLKPKGKGGRKPIYATSEERQKRNRKAQADFRKRRTEYIKQLEETIRAYESDLRDVRASYHHAANECLMLRYKNSLLQRVLLEKGTHLEAEFQARKFDTNLQRIHAAQGFVRQEHFRLSSLGQHSSSKSNSSTGLQAEINSPFCVLLPRRKSTTSPRGMPTPPSHSNSPNTGLASSPVASNTLSRQKPNMRPLPKYSARQRTKRPFMPAVPPGGVGSGALPSTSPPFEKEIKQIEKEYASQPRILDNLEEKISESQGLDLTGIYSDTWQPINQLSPYFGSVNSDPGLEATNQQLPYTTQELEQNLDSDILDLNPSMAFSEQFGIQQACSW